MELEKYYTPKIEEFYVGFEYEELKAPLHPLGIWDYEYIKFVSELDNVADNLEHNFNYIRVKYLDVDDIEDLGWNHLKHQSLGDLTWRFSIIDYNTRIEEDYSARYHNLYLRYYPDRHYIFIEASVDGEHETFFQGIIKNKLI